MPYKEVYTILDGVKGWGHYVGTYMAWGVNNSRWWGEGEIKFFMDGDGEFPTICGTGTEDYRFLRLREQGYPSVRGVYERLRGLTPGDKTGRPLRRAAEVRHVPLAYNGPRSFRREH